MSNLKPWLQEKLKHLIYYGSEQAHCEAYERVIILLRSSDGSNCPEQVYPPKDTGFCNYFCAQPMFSDPVQRSYSVDTSLFRRLR